MNASALGNGIDRRCSLLPAAARDRKCAPAPVASDLCEMLTAATFFLQAHWDYPEKTLHAFLASVNEIEP